MPSKCIVENCKNIGCHQLPKNDTLRQEWIKALQLSVLKKKPVRPNSRICSAHFRRDDFFYSTQCGIGNSQKRLKYKAIPSIIDVPKNQEEQQLTEPIFSKANDLQTYSKTVLPTTFVHELPFFHMESNDYENDQDPLASVPVYDIRDEVSDWPATNINGPTLEMGRNNVDPEVSFEVPLASVPDYDILDEESDWPATNNNGLTLERNNVNPEFSCEVEINSSGTECQQSQTLPKNNESAKSQQSDKMVQTDKAYEGLSIHEIKNNKREIHFYTGLEAYHKFKLIFDSLGRSAYQLNYFYEHAPNYLDPMNQLFMVMIILYRHKTYEELSMLFKTTIKQVYNIFITWIRFMYLQWKQIDLWVDKDIVQSHMPFDFYDMYPSTRVVLDATECPVKKPTLPLAQQITFSSYKNRNTIKFMIGNTKWYDQLSLSQLWRVNNRQTNNRKK